MPDNPAVPQSIDAVAYLLDHVRHLDAVVIAQQALLNRLLGDLEERLGDDEVPDALTVAEQNLAVALRRLGDAKRRWQALSEAAAEGATVVEPWAASDTAGGGQ